MDVLLYGGLLALHLAGVALLDDSMHFRHQPDGRTFNCSQRVHGPLIQSGCDLNKTELFSSACYQPSIKMWSYNCYSQPFFFTFIDSQNPLTLHLFVSNEEHQIQYIKDQPFTKTLLPYHKFNLRSTFFNGSAKTALFSTSFHKHD